MLFFHFFSYWPCYMTTGITATTMPAKKSSCTHTRTPTTARSFWHRLLLCVVPSPTPFLHASFHCSHHRFSSATRQRYMDKHPIQFTVNDSLLLKLRDSKTSNDLCMFHSTLAPHSYARTHAHTHSTPIMNYTTQPIPNFIFSIRFHSFRFSLFCVNSNTRKV